MCKNPRSSVVPGEFPVSRGARSLHPESTRAEFATKCPETAKRMAALLSHCVAKPVYSAEKKSISRCQSGKGEAKQLQSPAAVGRLSPDPCTDPCTDLCECGPFRGALRGCLRDWRNVVRRSPRTQWVQTPGAPNLRLCDWTQITTLTFCHRHSLPHGA